MKRLETTKVEGRSARSRDGFVLILVLALLTFAIVITTRYAQRSVDLTAQSRERIRKLQTRWGAWSLANGMMRLANEDANRLPLQATSDTTGTKWTRLSLGGQRFGFAVQDLDLAINVNTVEEIAGPSGLGRALASAGPKLGERLADRRSASGNEKNVFDSWGQLFELNQDRSRRSIAERVVQVQNELTCWGSGRINIRRAPDRVIQRFGSALGRRGLFSRVVRERNGDRQRPLADLITECSSNNRDTKLLKQTLIDQSGGWSIVIASADGGPTLHFVLEKGFGIYSDRVSVFQYP